MTNEWLLLANCRKIAAALQPKYCGQHYGDPYDPLEDKILTELWDHELYEESMWLETHWDDDDCLTWLQVGTGCGLVPR